MLIDCFYCGFPVEFQEKTMMDQMGVTLADCVRRDMHIICNVCADMMEVEGCKVEILDQEQFLKHLKESV
jgi:hypothetical protein